jgi:hypothetical protein
MGFFFLFATASRLALRPTQPPTGVERPDREADYSPASSAEVKNACSYTSIPPLRFCGVMFN